MPKVKITIPGFGTLAGTYTHDWDTGTTAYAITGPHVKGTFTLTHDPRRLVSDPQARTSRDFRDTTTYEVLDPDNPRVHVDYGDGTRRRPFLDHERGDRPVVNGVRLCGGTAVDTGIMRQRRLTRYDVNVRRGRWQQAAAPDATCARTALVLHGLVAHWIGRPENYALRLTATRVYAEHNIHTARQGVERARARLARAALEADREAAYLEQLGTAREMPAAPPAPEPGGIWAALRAVPAAGGPARRSRVRGAVDTPV